VFMLSVFCLCAFEYRFIFVAAVASAVLLFALLALRVVLAKSNKAKLKLFLGHALIFALAATLAIFYCIVRYNFSERPVLDYLEKYKGEPVHIKAEIKDVTSLSFMSVFDLVVREVNGEKSKGFNLTLLVYGAIEAGEDEIGDTFESYVVFYPIEESASSDSSLSYLKSGGYYIAAEFSDYEDEDEEGERGPPVKITPAEKKGMGYYLAAMRGYAKNIFFSNIKYDYHDTTTPEAAVVFGVFTGDKSHIEPEIKTDFKKSGISHALSVSGLHLSILCWIIFSFLKLFKVHKKISCAAIILCCLFFMVFTGFSLSIIRAGLMMILFYLSFLFGQKSDAITSLFFAGCVVVIANPYNTLNIGFQLSFFATFGIIFTASQVGKINSALSKAHMPKIIKWLLKIVVSSLLVSLAATFFTLPFVAYNFKTISLVSPLTNLLASPLVTSILFCALFTLIFSFVPFMVVIFAKPVYYVTKLLLLLAHWLASLKYSYISVESSGGSGFYVFALIFLFFVVLCLVAPKLSAKKVAKPILYAATVISFCVLVGSLVYPRIVFGGGARFAYYSDDKNQNIVMFEGDYDSADIIDMTHGTTSHVLPVYNMILENGAVRINSITLADYRKRHVQMIKKYLTYSDIKRVYVPEPKDDYDLEVLNLLYDSSISPEGEPIFELVKYQSPLMLGGAQIAVTNFDYDKMRHQAIEISCKGKSLLYLGIGYKEGYEAHTDIPSKNYDIVFYGTHKHNRRDDSYVSNIYGNAAGVLSSYFDADKNKTTQKLGAEAINAYRSGSVLFRSDDFGFIVFEIEKDGKLGYYLK
ncbi:MAG: ComEC/Rec2 family competence protein, partial [Oscillospiraceae bacterium]|nr:ComEC/Rec2 family competence protein [Oscillospiraceae bacterium]